MRHSFSIYFYLKRRKLQKDSKSTIMLRIIVNNKATDVSLKTSILQEHWDKQNKRGYEPSEIQILKSIS